MKNEKHHIGWTRQLSIVRPMHEAVVDVPARSMKVLIITEGLGNLKDKNFYSEQAVQSAVKVFNGKKFFIDHPSRSEEDDRPERSVRDLAGYFYECQLGQVRDPDTGEQLAACYSKLKFAESEPGELAFKQSLAALEYQKRFPQSKDVFCGISINGGGISHPANVKGVEVNMVTEIQEAFSADIVTMPARGGKFLAVVRESIRSGKQLTPSPRVGSVVCEAVDSILKLYDQDVVAFLAEHRAAVKSQDRRLGRLVREVRNIFAGAGRSRKGSK